MGPLAPGKGAGRRCLCSRQQCHKESSMPVILWLLGVPLVVVLLLMFFHVI